jgi:hypothetical protein
MISAVSTQASPPTSGDSTATPAADRGQHWLKGRYFVPMPDLSDETRWAISEGSAWPAWTAIMAVAHDLERRGATPEIRDDAFNGRIEVGVAGLAKAAGYGDKAILRQLRHLERVVGIIKTHQGDHTIERDPETGRVKANFLKAPPKVIIITIEDRHMRPTGPRRPPAAPGIETTPGRKSLGIETTPRGDDPRDRNDVVPIDRNLQRGFGHSDRNRRPAAAGHEGRPPRPPGQGQRPATPADRDAIARREQQHRLATDYAYHLGMKLEEVIALWKADKEELKRRLIEAGIDIFTGKRFKGSRMPPEGRPAASPADDTTFEIRRYAAQSVSLREDAPPQREAQSDWEAARNGRTITPEAASAFWARVDGQRPVTVVSDDPPAPGPTGESEDEERRRDAMAISFRKAAAEQELAEAVRKAPKASRQRAGKLGKKGPKAVRKAASG